MGLKRFFGLDCAEAAHTSHKKEYREAGLTDKIRLKFHLLLCPPCKDYSKKNHKLSDLLRKAKIDSCTQDEKERLRERMRQQKSQKPN